LAASSVSQSTSPSSSPGCFPPSKESLTINGLLIAVPERFWLLLQGKICHPTTTISSMWGGSLGCSEIPPFIPRAVFTTLLPQHHIGLGMVAHTLPPLPAPSPSVSQVSLSAHRQACLLLPRAATGRRV
jgi:hypothetical protein